MATRPSEEFKRDAVRIALTSGLMRRQVSSDPGVIPPVAIDHVLDFACHEDTVCNRSCNHETGIGP